MIDAQTLDRLKAMRLSGMAECFENLADTNGHSGRLTGPEMVKMAVLYLQAGELFDRITIAERTGERKRCSTRSSASNC